MIKYILSILIFLLLISFNADTTQSKKFYTYNIETKNVNNEKLYENCLTIDEKIDQQLTQQIQQLDSLINKRYYKK